MEDGDRAEQNQLTDLSLLDFQDDPAYQVLNYGIGQMNTENPGQGIPYIDPFG